MEIKYRRQFIEQSVKLYIKKYPFEYAAICTSVKKERAIKKDDFGLIDKDDAFIRWTLRIPSRLMNLLEKVLIEPRFLEAKGEIVWFKRNFPQFRVTEKI